MLKTLGIFGAQMLPNNTHRKTQQNIGVHRIPQFIRKRSPLGIKAAVGRSQKIVAVVHSDIHSDMLVGGAELGRKGHCGNERYDILIVTDAQMLDFSFPFQILKVITKGLVAHIGRRKRDVHDGLFEFVKGGGTKRKHGTQGCAERMASDIQRIVLVFGLVKKVTLQHANDFFSLAFRAAVGTGFGHFKQVFVKSFVDSAKGLAIVFVV